jgi:4-amino-4-deoxy-L-arabinose transferase-like glycosyltransferase
MKGSQSLTGQLTMKRYAMVFLASLAILAAGVAANQQFMSDEVFYVGAARGFIAGTASVNPEHPPLAKYLIALSIKTFGDEPLAWRFPSSVAGALAALAAFGLTLRLTRSLHSAYIAWGLLLANGFWYVMSRMASLSIFELAFEMAAVWAFMIAVEEKSGRWFAMTGAMFGLSIGSRWCGGVGLAVCAVYALIYSRAVKNTALMIGSAIAVYIATWAPLIVREHRSIHYLIAGDAFILQFHRHATMDMRPGEPWWAWLTTFNLPEALMELTANPVIGVLGLAAIAVLVWHRKPLLPALFIGHIMQWAITSGHWQHYYYYLEAFTWLTLALAVAMQGVTVRRIRADVLVTACAASLMVMPLWRAL